MTREKLLRYGKEYLHDLETACCKIDELHLNFVRESIKALEQEPRKDEVILTKEEYGELVSSEFDNGYAKGYREALEQEPILDKIKAEIAESGVICVEYKITGKRDKDIEQLVNDVLKQAKVQVLDVIDKYKAESEDRA